MTTYTADQIRDAIAKSKTIDDLASALEIQYQPAPQADFAGFTAKELEDYIQAEVLDVDEDSDVSWGYGLRESLEDGIADYTLVWNGITRKPVKPFPHGKVRVEDDEETGGEGSQEDIYIVLSVESPEGSKRYFRKEGYYASYDGSTWDGDFHEVWPKQKEITVWVSKKP